jgi:uncharacterized cupredoxin-like copper-binding protein
MRLLKQLAVLLVSGFAFAQLAGAASAATIVHVELWDKGADMEMPKGLVYGAPGVDLSTAPMGVKASPSSAPTGDVTFDVTNTSKDTIHEMIVMYVGNSTKPLPYIDNEERVDEEKVRDLGEVSELDPGGSGALTVHLDPGKYLLICNVPGHYAAGMWTEFDVTAAPAMTQ